MDKFKFILSIFLILCSISWTHGLFEQYLRPDDSATYNNFVTKVESRIKRNCNNDLPMSRVQRKVNVQQTLSDMRRIMSEYDSVDNCTYEFPWRALIEYLDLLDFQERGNSDLDAQMKKIWNYWMEMEKIAKAKEAESWLSVGCSDPGRYFPWKVNVDSEFCYKNVNDVYEQFIMAIKEKMKRYGNRLNICGIKEALQNEMIAFSNQGIKAHTQRHILDSYEQSVNNLCQSSCINSELQPINYQYLQAVEAFKSLMAKTIQEFSAYIKKCEQPPPRPARPNIPNPCKFNPYPCIEPPKVPKIPAYIELERAYQVKIMREQELSKSGSCAHNCDISKIDGVNTAGECQGYQDCRPAVSNFDVCEASAGKSRYEWVKEDGNVVFGKENACYGRTKSFYTVFNYVDWRWDQNCGACICTCVSKPQRDEHTLTAISFLGQVSDYHNNRVVVGVRFVRKDFMVHLQIAEGQLLPGGRIDPSTASWKKLQDIELIEQKFFLKRSGTPVLLTLGADYGHPSKLNLDELIAPDNFVITGVKFHTQECPESERNSIELQIQVHRIDIAGGYVDTIYKPRWISAGNKIRCELKLQDPDNPLKAQINDEMSASDQFVRFQASSFLKDAGQSTVPFLDAVDVIANGPLKGIGIFHRGHAGFGGFISLRLHDFSSNVYSVADVRKKVPAPEDDLEDLPLLKLLIDAGKKGFNLFKRVVNNI